MTRPAALNLLSAYVALLHLAAALNMIDLLPGGKPAFLVDLATLAPVVLGAAYFVDAWRAVRLTPLDWAVGAYGVLSLVSAAFFLDPSNPSAGQAFFYGVHYFVLPMSLYFAVKTIDASRQTVLLRRICVLNTAAILIGLILFYLRPGFYHAYLVEKVFAAAPEPMAEWQLFGRLQSYLGSTAVGTVAASTLVLLALIRPPLPWTLFSAGVVLLGSVLTYQRGGTIAALIAAGYLAFNASRSAIARAVLPVLMAVGTLLAVWLYVDLDPSYGDRLRDKYSWESMREMVNWGDRGYGPGIAYVMEFPFGVGLGGTSSAAHAEGLASRGQVVDANFMRILADLGLVGALAFSVVLWQAARSAVRKQKRPGGWLLLIGLIGLISLGTNTLDSFYVAHCFWIFLGVIDTRNRPAGILRAAGFTAKEWVAS